VRRRLLLFFFIVEVKRQFDIEGNALLYLIAKRQSLSA